MPEENTGPRQFREVDKSIRREQLVIDSLKLGDTVRAAERARKGIDEKYARRAEKDSLILGNSARAPEQQGLSGGLNNTPKNPPNK